MEEKIDMSVEDMSKLADGFFDTRRYEPEDSGVEFDSDGLPVVHDSEEGKS